MPKATQDKSDPTKSQPATRTVKERKPSYRREPRPDIPEQTKRELWGRAAGRCEFHGCNEILYFDSVTKQRANLATIAHIVAFSPEGPRGHSTRSKELEVELENLMLTCKKHGDLIDNLNYVDQYPEATLLGYKKDHERRVHDATDTPDDAKTDLLIVQGRVNSTRTIIDEKEAKRAARPRWPAKEESCIIDLNQLTLSKDSPAYWLAASDQIITGVQDLLRARPGDEGIKHLSVFAILPIPLLALLGHKLSSRINADLFQFQRSKPSQKWCWNEGQPSADEGLDVYKPDERVDVEDAVIIASISGIVDRQAASRAVNCPHVIYEIRALDPGTDFLKYRAQLLDFGIKVRHVLMCIRRDFKRVQRLHLILGCPASMAIEIGRSLEYIDSQALVYEVFKVDNEDTYRHVLTINDKGGTS